MDHEIDENPLPSIGNFLSKIVVPLLVIIGALWALFNTIQDIREKHGENTIRIESIAYKQESVLARLERDEMTIREVQRTIDLDRAWGSTLKDQQEMLKELQKEMREQHDQLREHIAQPPGDQRHK